MPLFLFRGIRVCGPERIFEQLEERIVLDASLDWANQDQGVSQNDGQDLFSGIVSVEPGTDHHVAVADADAPDDDLNVVLISDQLPELGMLEKAAESHAQVIIFDAGKDNLDTINVRLHDLVEATGKKIDHLAVLDHAKAGEWKVGTDRFDLFSLPARRASFQTLGSMLNDGAQLQLYGCSLAGDPMGQALVDRIAFYTHSDVFASFKKVGGNPQHQTASPHNRPSN